MDTPLRAPRNRTAELQLIQRLVGQGYTLWTADQIPLGKLPGFLDKWARYRLQADSAARAYRKQTKRANSYLVLAHQFNALDPLQDAATPIDWLILSTPGKDGLGDGLPSPGKIRTADHREQHVHWMGYELLRQPKSFKDGEGRLRHEVTWTWRIPGIRYREYEALLISLAKARDYAALDRTFDVLKNLPMFAGIRQQVLRLHTETNRMLKKMGGSMLPPLDLPFMTMQPIWLNRKAP